MTYFRFSDSCRSSSGVDGIDREPLTSSSFSVEDELFWFRSLVYSKYTFLTRCRHSFDILDAPTFSLFQGIQPVIRKYNDRLVEAIFSGSATGSLLSTICECYKKDIEAVYKLRSRAQPINSLTLLYEPPIRHESGDRAENDFTTNDAEHACGDSEGDWAKDALEHSLKSVSIKFTDDPQSFLIKNRTQLFSKLLYNPDTSYYKALCSQLCHFGFSVEPLVSLFHKRRRQAVTPCDDNISRPLHLRPNALDSKGRTNHIDSTDVQDVSSRLKLSFESMIIRLKTTITSSTYSFTKTVLAADSQNDPELYDFLNNHLKSFQDDVLLCPCDYKKWTHLLVSGSSCEISATLRECYDVVSNHLALILSIVHKHRHSFLFELCIDLMFCVAIRHPNPCESLQCCLTYCKTYLIPDLRSLCNQSDSSENDTLLWLPRLSGSFDCLADLDYFALHHPLLLNGRECSDGGTCDRLYETSVPLVGCYVLSLDIEMSDSGLFDVNGPATTTDCFRLCVRKSGDNPSDMVSFISDGHQMVVLDSSLAVIDLHSLSCYRFEFLFYNGNLLIYLNGTRFYTNELCVSWDLNKSVDTILMTFEYNSRCLNVEEPWNISPGLRSEMIKRELATNVAYGNMSYNGSLFESLYERALFLYRVTTTFHDSASRIFYAFKGFSSDLHGWNSDFLRYVRLMFENLSHIFECIRIASDYYALSNTVNSLTLWRILAQTILSLVSTLRLSLSNPTARSKIPADLLDLMASCYIQCMRFRPLVVNSTEIGSYHLQFDIDDLSHAINMTAVCFVRSNVDIFTQMFSKLRLEVLSELLQVTVDLNDAKPDGIAGNNYILKALEYLNNSDCIKIFTKRALLPNTSHSLCRGSLGDIDFKNIWWNMIKRLLDSGRQYLLNSSRSRDVNTIPCTGKHSSSNDALSSPYYTCDSCVRFLPMPTSFRIGQYMNRISDAGEASLSFVPLFLCRLLLKHGVFYLCLNISECHKENSSVVLQNRLVNTTSPNTNKDRFCDWSNDVLLDVAADCTNNGLYNTQRIFNKDNVLILEYIMSRLVMNVEVGYTLAAKHLHELSSDLMSPFTACFYNFIQALSLIEIMDHIYELFERVGVADGYGWQVYRIYGFYIRLLPALLHVTLQIWVCIKRYSKEFNDFSIPMNYVVLQFHSLVSLLGKFSVVLFKHSRGYSRRHLNDCPQGLYTDTLAIIKGLDKSVSGEVPQWLLHGSYLSLDNNDDLVTSLRRLINLLQDINYDSGTLRCDTGLLSGYTYPSHHWASLIMSSNPEAIARLGPGFRIVHPSFERCQLGILAVFIHLLGCTYNHIDFSVRTSSQAILQLLQRLQTKHSLILSSLSEGQSMANLREQYVEDITSRCSWLINNTRCGSFHLDNVLTIEKSVDRSSRRSFSSSCEYKVGNGPAHSSGHMYTRLRSAGRRTSSRRCSTTDGGNISSYTRVSFSDNRSIEITPFIVDITRFLLYGPDISICKADLNSQRVSTVCRYAMWLSVQVLSTLINDIRIGNSSEDPYVYGRQLLVDVVCGPDVGSAILCSEGLHKVCLHFWSSIVSTCRDMVLVLSSEGITDPCRLGSLFHDIILRSQEYVLERLCSWYLSSGICNMELSSSIGLYVPMWARISLPFFVLQYSLGLDPMAQSRYASPIFSYLLSLLHPLGANFQDGSSLNFGVTSGIGSIIMVFVSYMALQTFSNAAMEVFRTLWSSKYVRYDVLRVRRGYLYLWVKRKCDMLESVYNPELRLDLLWSTSVCSYTDINLTQLSDAISNIGKESSEKKFEDVPNDISLWHMCPTTDSVITEASMLNTDSSEQGSGIDLRNDTFPICINVILSKCDGNSTFVDTVAIQHLDGKLEVDKGGSNWSVVSHDPDMATLHPLRSHLHFLVRFLLWVTFNSNIYICTGPVSTIDTVSCLVRLILTYLRDNCSLLSSFNSLCAPCETIPQEDRMAYRYTCANLEDDCNDVTFSGQFTNCNKCSTSLIYRNEVEYFWTSLVTRLSSEIIVTKNYYLAHYVMSCILSSFSLGYGQIESLLSCSRLGPAFCALFTACTRRACDKSLTDHSDVISTIEKDVDELLSPGLHGMFLYRWLPPLEICPREYVFNSAMMLFKTAYSTPDTDSKVGTTEEVDPFASFPHSAEFVAHNNSADFESEITGTSLHVTRAGDMGGIVLFRIPLDMVSTSSHGSVNFFILSSGRFGITVAPADCIFGSVTDLFVRNDVVGFMTSSSLPFTHDVFAATINYRVGDILAASFAIDQRDDGQVCLRTELLIGGNSIGSVLEVVYDPFSQSDPLRRMSLVFIFQDPQTIVYNGFSDTPAGSSGRVVSRETLSTFRSNTASDHHVDISLTAADGVSATENVVRQPSIPVAHRRTGNASANDRLTWAELNELSIDPMDDRPYIDPPDKMPSALVLTSDWNVGYDVPLDSGNTYDHLSRLYADTTWTDILNLDHGLIDITSATMFTESIQLYQSLFWSESIELSGLKLELVSQMCISFESVYNCLLTKVTPGPDELIFIRKSYSWLAVLGCDTDSDRWKTNLDNVSRTVMNFKLPWLLGSSSTTDSCCSQLTAESCRKLFESLSDLLSVPAITDSLLYLFNPDTCANLSKPEELGSRATLLAFGSAALLCCVILGKVLVEKGCVFDTMDPMSSFSDSVDKLFSLAYKLIGTGDMATGNIPEESFSTLLSMLGIDIGDDNSDLDSFSLNSRSESMPNDVALYTLWSAIYRAVESRRLNMPQMCSLDGKRIDRLAHNSRMFGTFDKNFHSGIRNPGASRHFYRLSRGDHILKSDVYDLLVILVAACPDYFIDRLISLEDTQCIELIRSCIQHFGIFYDPNGPDYWHWVYTAREVSVSAIDQYSCSVDPLYSLQRLLYLEGSSSHLNRILNVLYTELIYCVAMLIHDTESMIGTCDVIYWLLDILQRHPCCSGLIRRRFVTGYTWSLLHLLFINCSALPCKLAVVASRLTYWIAPSGDRSQMIMTTQYCATSALRRYHGVCSYYNVSDLDFFTNFDYSSEEHATKYWTAVLIHSFATSLSILMEYGCDPYFDVDDMVAMAHYISVGKGSGIGNDNYMRHILHIPAEFTVSSSVPTQYRIGDSDTLMNPVFVKSSRSRSLCLSFNVKHRTRVLLYHDRECLHLIGESVLHPDVHLLLSNGKPVYVDRGDPLPFNKMRQLCIVPVLVVHRDVGNIHYGARIRIGFVTSGMYNLTTSCPKVHLEGCLLYVEIEEDVRVSQMVYRDHVVWEFGLQSVTIKLPHEAELLRPYIVVLHPDLDYQEDVLVARSMLNVCVGKLCYCIYSPSSLSIKDCDSYREVQLPFRPGISMSNCSYLADSPSGKHLDMFDLLCVYDHSGIVDLDLMSSHMALPFVASLRVQSSHPDVYIGLEWLGLRFLWFANGTVEVPVDCPLYGSTVVRTRYAKFCGIGYDRDDLVSLQFVPGLLSLLFILNNDVRMVLDFRRFYDPLLDYCEIGRIDFCLCKHADYLDIPKLHLELFNAIIDNKVMCVHRILSQLKYHDITQARSLLEVPLSVNYPGGPYDNYNALYVCCLLNRCEILRYISLVPGVNFDSPCGSGSESPLMAAARHGCTMIISYLITLHGVDVNYRDSYGNTGIMHALMECANHNPAAVRIHSVQRTVQVLLAFGADILVRNGAGSTVLDLLPYHLKDMIPLCKFVINQYNLQQSMYVAPCASHLWPGLLGGSNLIFGCEDATTTNHFELTSLVIDNIDIYAEPHASVSQFNELLGYLPDLSLIEHGLDNIRDGIINACRSIGLSLLMRADGIGPGGTVSSPRPDIPLPVDIYLSPVKIDTNSDLIHGLRSVLLTFVDEIMQFRDWKLSNGVSTFCQLCTDFCRQLSTMSGYHALVSFISFEHRVTKLLQHSIFGEHLNIPSLPFRDPSDNRISITTLQWYTTLLSGTPLLECQYSLFTTDYLALSCGNAISRYLDNPGNSVLETDTDYPLPLFSSTCIDVEVTNGLYTFDKIRHTLNRSVSKELDMALHSISDLLSNSGHLKRKICAIVMQCGNTTDLASRLPPLDSPLWNGISLGLNALVDSLSKLKQLVVDHVSGAELTDVDFSMLLHHLALTVDESAVKEFIMGTSSGSIPTAKLSAVVEKMQIGDIASQGSDGEMFIVNVSDMNDPNSHIQDPFLSPVTFASCNSVIAAFCYLLVTDRLRYLEHVNLCFKFVAPVIGTVLNQGIVDYRPLQYLTCPSPEIFFSAPPCWSIENLKFTPESIDNTSHGISLGPPQLPVHWSVYFNNRCLIRRSLINEMYSKVFLSSPNVNRQRPYVTIRVSRGLSSTGTGLMSTLWYQSCYQLLGCNPDILRARNGQRPFMVVFRGEGATDFGGPFQELLSSIGNEVMSALDTGSHDNGCVKCPNSTGAHGLFQDTVLLKSGGNIHPMLSKLLNLPDLFKYNGYCCDTSIWCSSGCCTGSHAMGGTCVCNLMSRTCHREFPIEFPMYEALGRLFAMCVCMMNPLNVSLNPVVWKKFLGVSLGLRDISDFDKMSVDFLHRLSVSPDPDLYSDLCFTFAAPEGGTIDLLEGGSRIAVNQENLDTFVRLATHWLLTHGDVACTYLLRGFNAVLPVGRFRMLLDHRLLEFMVCGDPRIDLEVLRGHTISSSIQLKRDLFNVLARFDNRMLQLFLRFVSGRSRLPQSQIEWNMYVEYDQIRDNEDCDQRLPTAATCSFRLLVPRYSSTDILFQRLSYAVQHCMAIDLDGYQVNDDINDATM
ncbi:HECT/ubiquitin-transferase domain containing protein [Babesia bovis T2Bo]|uniref:HECT/ubiquitin-transferase domain containing protein n=1 Tax=Babesia bovis TaxID=5865 RepID=A7ASG6_BABBO|nr:HECT/ubiquitin-transferase domain containing protein [Babesia bovis T2Bo]EDO07485.1 HECT/ubiquitin-transferase domain containing protein [Babesia bovis T2Bo]|eukprot:XP_001611053.1 HECT/ubiquitin-transferase domain containing protein [Babesia bovis T2Bo]